MKNFLSLIVCLTFAIGVFAQDVIVKKDGSIIQAKVEKVTSTEVEYKKADNPDGPTYTVSIDELLSINYQNGSRDVFGTPNTNAIQTNNAVPTASLVHSSGYFTDETASRYSNDYQLVRQHQYEYYKKKAKTWKMIGLIGGSTLFVVGGVLILTDLGRSVEDYAGHFAVMGIGLVGGTTCYLIGHNYSKKAAASRSLIGFDYSFENGSNLSFGLEPMGTYYNPGIGVGVRYNF